MSQKLTNDPTVRRQALNFKQKRWLPRHPRRCQTEKVFYACLDVTIPTHRHVGTDPDLKKGSKESSCLRDKRGGLSAPATSIHPKTREKSLFFS